MKFPGRFFERGGGVHNSLMNPYDKLPCPDSPKLQVALEVCLALEVVLKINLPSRSSLSSLFSVRVWDPKLALLPAPTWNHKSRFREENVRLPEQEEFPRRVWVRFALESTPRALATSDQC